jgi:sugar/nucleoside kinase (ribokinase family)
MVVRLQSLTPMSQVRPTVIVIGEFFIDEILSGFQTLPKLGEESFARHFRREVGGGAAITACGLAKLGVPVAVLGAVGSEDGAYVIKRLSSYGVDCTGMELDPTEATGLTVSVSTREDRAFFSYYGANRLLARMLNNPETLHRIKAARHIHFACAPDSELQKPMLLALRRRRRRISIDVQSHMSWLTKPANLEILRNCDIFFPNEREAEWVAGEEGTPQGATRSSRQRSARRRHETRR